MIEGLVYYTYADVAGELALPAVVESAMTEIHLQIKELRL